MASDAAAKVGVVAIGRNEGNRLRSCLASVNQDSCAVVYVDSGSDDGSVDMARGMGVDVVMLDSRMPFTAGRARNEGFSRLRQLAPDVQFVQFVDGDCEILSGWLQKAATFLEHQPRVAAVCGRLRERYPEGSIYNRLCDLEWDRPAGEAKACGGNAVVRRIAFEEAGGFLSTLIAGEEPELCVRLRGAGWRVWRLPDAMALHDAAMTRFGQWWRRCVRNGHAFAEGAHIHGRAPERHYVRELRRAWIWGAFLPGAIILLAAINSFWLLAISAYPAEVARLAFKAQRSRGHRWLQALFLVLGRFPECLGQLHFVMSRITGKRRELVAYKQ